MAVCLAAGVIGWQQGVIGAQEKRIDQQRQELGYQEDVTNRLQDLYHVPSADARRIVRTVFSEARAVDMDPEIPLCMMAAESGFDPMAVSERGAVGLMQVRASIWVNELGIGDWKLLYQPETNIRAGVAVLSQYMRQVPGHALTAYNRGITAVRDDLRAGRDPDNGYVARVAAHCRRLAG